MKYLKKFKIFETIHNQEGIDDILDKISSEGIESLTEYEKIVLDNHSNPNFNLDYKTYLISKIKDFFSSQSEDIFTMQDLQAGSSPVYKEIDQTIDLIERIETDRVEVVRYGGYKYNTELDDYYVDYEDLSIENLEDIINLL